VNETPDLPPPGPHELATSSNTHELKGDEKDIDPSVPAAQKLDSYELEPKSTVSPTSEMDPQYSPHKFDFSPVHELDPHLQQQHDELTSQEGDGILSLWVTRAELEAERASKLGDTHQPQPQSPSPPLYPSSPSSPITRKAVPVQAPGKGVSSSNETEAQKEARLKILTERSGYGLIRRGWKS
jgi:hypothetical protein